MMLKAAFVICDKTQRARKGKNQAKLKKKILNKKKWIKYRRLQGKPLVLWPWNGK